MTMSAKQQGFKTFLCQKSSLIAALALVGLIAHLCLRFIWQRETIIHQIPLLITLVIGGIPLLIELGKKTWRREFGSDFLAGLSIVISAILGEYLAGSIVVLMLSGGETLEAYAVQSASSVLQALAKRMPSVAHRDENGTRIDVAITSIQIDDRLVVFPHEICPVDGVVVEGHGRMDESFLTGEPFEITKVPGANVISGAINGEVALVIRATRRAEDSRYAKIMRVMRESEQRRPRIRRLGDQLGAFYTPLALLIATGAWLGSGESVRFLAVLVVATPCPLLLAIPISIIGSISLCARRGIIVKNPVVLEQINLCRTVIFDKTGTLTYGEPRLTEQIVQPQFKDEEVLGLTASLEGYSKHPLARAIITAAKQQSVPLTPAEEISEAPGQGLVGTINGRKVQITNRAKLMKQKIAGSENLPPIASGLECAISIDNVYAATYRFHDAPRADGLSFIKHLGPKHRFTRAMIVSGDREAEVRYLAERAGITEVHAEKSPEEKLTIVRNETSRAKTLYVGDGINDAPAMMASTVGIAMGQNSDITAEAAGAIVLEGELKRVDEFMHISRRMRIIALQSAVGGMILSLAGMLFASAGLLSPVAGAITQEAIDVLAILNAIRAAFPPKKLSDLTDRH